MYPLFVLVVGIIALMILGPVGFIAAVCLLGLFGAAMD